MEPTSHVKLHVTLVNTIMLKPTCVLSVMLHVPHVLELETMEVVNLVLPLMPYTKELVSTLAQIPTTLTTLKSVNLVTPSVLLVTALDPTAVLLALKEPT